MLLATGMMAMGKLWDEAANTAEASDVSFLSRNSGRPITGAGYEHCGYNLCEPSLTSQEVVVKMISFRHCNHWCLAGDSFRELLSVSSQLNHLWLIKEGEKVLEHYEPTSHHERDHISVLNSNSTLTWVSHETHFQAFLAPYSCNKLHY